MSQAIWKRERMTAPIVAAISAITLMTVYASQYIGGLFPCPLCLYQRWPWWAALGFAAVATMPILSASARSILVALAGLSILIGAGIAVFHVGVEQHWWPGLASCGEGGQSPTSIDQLQQMMNQPAVSCDTPAWTMFGISMAGYNAILSIVVGLWALIAAIGHFRRAGEQS